MQIVRSRFITCINIFFILCCVACTAGNAQINPPNIPVYTVPVVFHIISNGPSTITDQQIIDAVQDLNDAFAHSGPYATGAPGTNTKIRFCLARIDPDGGISSGITRTQSVLSNFDQDIENDRLKSLVSWNTSQYCNIWCVDSVKNEYYTNFSCGAWTRKHNKTYASFLPGGDYRDGIATTGFGSPLATLMGSYLGLNPTFVYGSCENNDCNSNGDGICDTPPASGPAGSCTGIQNSCSSDTLSGFTIDMPDLISNFMSYSGPCTNSFTNGQSAKMRSTLTGSRNSLLTQNKCVPPCTANITVSFTRDIWLPVPGDLVHFNAISSGGTNYQWTVDGIPVGTNSAAYMQTFTQAGKYKVLLKVYNANIGCFASYSDSVIVSCGVLARFSPDKRLIAAKDQILNDSIFFNNLSVNATTYQWWISNNTGMSPQIVSTGFNLNQIFHSPGLYAVWLVASNGSCSDTSEKFNFTVNDPTVDGTVSLRDVECYEETKIILVFAVCNNGYVPIPAGTPVTFYDGDPQTGSAKKLDSIFYMPTAVAGNCCTYFSTVLNIGTPGLNQLYAVFNDNGKTKPLVLPNTPLPESNFTNNIGFANNFQFKVKVNPPAATLEPGDTLRLSGSGTPGIVSSYLWTSTPEMSCTDCADPLFTAGKNNVTEKLIAASSYGCVDSTNVLIKIIPPDFTTQILETYCYTNDSLLVKFSICANNGYDSLFAGIPVSFYDGNWESGQSKLLEPTFITTQMVAGNCDSFSTTIKAPLSNQLSIVVNDKGQNNLNSLDTAYTETDYSNNSSSIPVIPFSVSINPTDTTVNRLMPVPLHIQVTGGQLASFNWSPSEFLSCTNCFEPVITPPHSLQYELEVQNEYACTAKAYVQINTITGGKVNIPNAFTPNGDGHNDIFYIMGSQEIKIINEFSIFNRWGQVVFTETNVPANDSRFGWNGLINGKPSPVDAYVYFVVIEFKDGSKQVYKGSVLVIL